MDGFIDVMFQIVSWPVVKSILTTQVPTIQAFAENVFRFAITTENVQVVRDLLRQQSLKELVQSDAGILVSAIRTSNTKVVSLLLSAGADAKGTEYSLRNPLSEARTVGIARLLLVAGANVNGTSRPWNDEVIPWHLRDWNDPPVLFAAASGNVELTQFLINSGADVNAHGSPDFKYKRGIMTLSRH